MPDTTLPHRIRQRLSHTRNRLRMVDMALGSARAILAVSFVLISLFALDTMLEPPLAVVRAFALFMALVAFSAAAAFLAKPMRRELSDDRVALLVEEEYPELHGGLVSSVQLARELGRDDLYTSRALIQSTIDQTSDRVEGMNFDRIVNSGPLVPLWGLIVAFMAVGALLFTDASVREYAGIFYQRVIEGDDIPYPTLVRIEVQLDRNHQVAKGDDLMIKVKVTKGARLVKGLELNIRHSTHKELQIRRLEARSDTLYRCKLDNVTDPLSFFVSDPLNGVRSQTYHVTVVQRPWVEQHEFVLTYPDYTGKPPQTVRLSDLRVPAGTFIAYAVVSNKPLASGKLMFETEVQAGKKKKKKRAGRSKAEATDGKQVEGPAPLPWADVSPSDYAEGGELAELGPTVVRLGLGSEGRGARALLGRFQVKADMRFRFDLVSTEGLESGSRNVVFSVTAVPDQQPVVNIPVPGRRKQVTPQAKVPLVVEARDDYGVADVVLMLEIQKEDSSAPASKERIQLEGVEDGARSLRLPYTLDMADLRLLPGDRLRYTAIAYDHNIRESRRAKSSRPYEIQIVRPDDLERMLQDRLASLKERLQAAARDQVTARKSSVEFVAKLGPKVALGDGDKRTLQRITYEQRRVTSRLTDVERELKDIQAERKLNRLTEEASMELLAELEDGVQELAERASPLVAQRLEDSRAAARLDQLVRSRLVRVPDLQREILEGIQSLISRIDKWGDFTEVLQEVRDLLQGEESLIDKTRKAVQSEHR